ncbi:uncharacterized protein LOC129225766 [Uloborus diversus]|uniref:uncharacterized protein LOC129225766 n=1 Tax=Uloborus diversus TaxID=327109 RepID=UPI00240A85D7|nr:uncharacterized protein LOC129225766 [Uloborus diversus]
MKIEPEVACALYAFTSSSEGGGGGGGCSPVDPGRSAQDPSIAGSGRGPFDCEHFQFIDEDDAAETPSQATKEEGGPSGGDPLSTMLRPALVRKGAARRPRGRVSFDEAVVLYADEHGGPQTLALTTGPEAPEVFCTFEPPDEYRDVPPFEPPAEYRDSEEEPPQARDEPPPEPEASETTASGEPPLEMTPEPAKDTTATTTTTTQESDQLFERFLEAEREFAADDELDSVFHALEDEFSNSKGSNSLDDSFFRKLIHLLSSAETPPSEEPPEEGEEEEAHSRTLSEADSDCSISSQDTIIVRLGEEPGPDVPADDPEAGRTAERPDEVFAEEEQPGPQKEQRAPAAARGAGEEESLSRQSSGEQSVASSQDPPQDADDSTSSDSRSGEVEEEIRLDDIGYDEEDADDYDEESFRGMARGNSKIRRIIRKNALQCTLLRGVEAKRRAPRPKSPLLSQESLVEKLKWLTTVDEAGDPPPGPFQPPDVILSAGGLNGSLPSSEDDFRPFYPTHAPPQYYFPAAHHPSLPRQRTGFPPAQHTLPHRAPPSRPAPWPEQQQQRTMTVPRNFRDWRVIQRISAGRGGDAQPRPPAAHVQADYVRCAPNGACAPPPDVTAPGRDELEQFARQDSCRTERIRKRYSVAEEDDDPTFGFARRPSVRGVQVGAPRPPPDPRMEPPFEDQRRSVYGGPGWGGAYAPPHQRASVALAPNATLPYAHRRPPQDPRYHSYAESVWGPSPWAPLRDERGAPEGASSSPKVSSDSLYHHPAGPDSCGGPSPRKEDGVIYYSLNV